MIQIGSGTTGPGVGSNPGAGANGASPYGVNVNSGAGGKRLQILYTAAQINAALSAAGLTPGVPYVISTTSWDVSNDVGAASRNQIGTTIKMANTAAASLAFASPITGLTTVFGATNITYPAGTGYLVTNTLATPFTWDGTSNLVIEYCYTFTGVGLITTYGGCRRTATSAVQMTYNGGSTINCGTVLATNVSAIPNIRMTVTSACTQPSPIASGVNFSSVSSTSATVNWTNGGGASRVVVAHATTAVSAGPTTGVNYAAGANSDITLGQNLGSSNIVVYAGTGNSVTVTGLAPGTNYFFSVYEASPTFCYSAAASGSMTTQPCQPAITNATNLTFTSSSNNSLSGSFTRGSGDQVMVVARLSATARVQPTYNVSYTASSVFGSGSTTGAGNFVVFNGTGNAFTVTGLANFSAYSFDIYEYNASPNCYTQSPLIGSATTLDATQSGGCSASVTRTATAMSAISPTTILQTGNVTNTNYPGQPIGFTFNYGGTNYTSFGLNTNGYIWFGTGTPLATATNPISNASPNLGGTGTIDGIISVMGTFVNANFNCPTVTPTIGYTVTGTAPNRVLTIQWLGYTPTNVNSGFCGTFSNIDRVDFQIKLNESGGLLSNQIVMSYSDESPYFVSAAISAQVGLRGASNASFTNRTNTASSNGSWGNAAGALNTSVCATTASTWISGATITFVQANPTAPTISGSATNICPASTTTLTASAGATSYQWFLNGAIIPGPGSNGQSYTATQSGSYTVVTNTAGCYAASAPLAVTISSCCTAPTINCPANVSVNTSPGMCENAATFAATATGSPAPTISYSQASGSSFPVGITPVTATATNSCGTASCNFTVTVIDNEPPFIDCNVPTINNGPNQSSFANDVTLPNDLGQCTAMYSYSNEVSDNCTGFTVAQTAGLPDGSNFPVGTTTNTFVATDAAGNTSSCSFDVTVEDVEMPVVICPAPINVATSGSSCDAVVTFSTNATDNCPGVSVAYSTASGSIFGIGTNSVTATATDASGNTAACAFTVTVSDNTPPSSVCQNLNLSLDSTGSVTVTPAQLDGGSSDNCAIASMMILPPNGTICGTVPEHGLLTLTAPFGTVFTSIDFASYGTPNGTCGTGFTQGSCHATNSASIIAATFLGQNSASIAAENAVFGDPCPGTFKRLSVVATYAAVTTNSVTYDCHAIGTNGLTLVVTDAAGNSSTCASTVTVSDLIAPTIACPASITANTSTSSCDATVSYAVNAQDNTTCITTTQTAGLGSGASFQLGVTTNSFTVTDAGGNSANCSFTVTVEDHELPTITCVPDMILNADPGACSATVSFVTTNGIANTMYAVDGYGAEIHTFNSPQNHLSSVIVNVPGYYVSQHFGLARHPITGEYYAISGNASDRHLITVDPVTGNGVDIGPLNFLGVALAFSPNGTLYAASGNAGANNNKLFSLNTTNAVSTPLLNLPSAGGRTMAYNDDDGFIYLRQCNAFLQIDPINLTTTNIPISGYDAGCVSAMVYQGNGELLVADIVQNGVYSTLTTAGFGTVGNSVNYNLKGIAFAPQNGIYANDNCTYTVTQTCGLPSGSNFPIGTTQNCFTVTDGSGNTASCAFQVTVNDNQNPTIVCPANVVVSNDPGSCGAAVTYAANASDNCPGVVVAFSPASGSNYGLGTTSVTATATDASGNTATCAFTVTVNDNEAPVVTCPANVVLSAAPGACSATATFAASATDNCPGATVALSHASGSAFPVGTTTVTATATDASGNTAACAFTVRVNDTQAPVVSCPPSQIVCATPGTNQTVVNYTSATATDNCAGVTVVRTAGLASGASFPVGNTTVAFTATDASGNTATCSFVVTVNQFTANSQVFAERIGAVSSTTSIAAYESANGFDNDAYTMTGTADIRSTTPSTGYSGASGTGNVFFTGPGSTFEIAGINTSNFSTMGLAFGLFKSTTASNASDFLIQVSTDGVTYTTVPHTLAATGTGTATWNTYSAVGFPSASNLRIRFTNAGTTQYRLDDIILGGTTNSATITNVGNTSFCPGGSVTLVASLASSYLWSTGETTQSIVVSTAGSYSVTVTGANGCQAMAGPVAVTVFAAPSVTATGVNATCPGATNGSATATATGGTPGYAYLWTPSGQTTVTANNLGAASYTVRVTDANGCTATSNVVTLTDNDIVAPVAHCQNVTVQLNASGLGSATAAVVNNGSTDNCSIISLALSNTAFTCAQVGASNTVTLTVTDVGGNTATCTATVTVQDLVPPTAICQNLTVNLSASGNASINASQVNNGSTDNCGVASVTATPLNFTCADVAGDPVADLFISEYLEGSGNNKAIEIYNGTGASVNLSGYTLEVSFNGGGTTQTVALSGSVANGDVFVVANPASNAAILAQADLTSNVIQFNGNDAVSLKKNTLTLDIVGRVGQDPGTAWTGGGNSTLDRTLVRNSTVHGGNTSNALNFPSIASEWTGFPTDNSANLGSHSFNARGNGVTLTVTDINGNTSTCASSVVVNDVTPPNAVCQNVTVNLDGSGAASMTATQVNNGSSDACGVASIVVSTSYFSCANVGSNNVTLTVTDVNGNSSTCAAIVTVQDNIAPAITCPASLSVSASVGACDASVSYSATATDNCAGTTVAYSPASGSTFSVGTTSVTATATDASGNASSCAFTVTVTDNESPTVTCPANISVNNDPGVCGANVTYTVAFADNCPGSNLAQTNGLASGSTYPIGLTTNAFTVTDAHGNTATCAFSITVTDNEAPTIDCNASAINNGPNSSLANDVTLPNDLGFCSAVLNYSNDANDNCPGFTVLQTAGLPDGSAFPVGTTTNTFVVTDASGNTASCSFNVIVQDVENPILVCPANIVVANDSGVCGAAVSFSATASDNCPGVTIAYGTASGTTFAVGTSLVAVTATDASGNTAACSFTVTVNDTELPTIICPANMVVSGTSGAFPCTGLATFATPAGSDNCAFSVAQTAGLPSGSNFPEGFNAVTFTVTDASGNTAACTFTIEVGSCNRAPVAVCQNLTLAADGNCEGQATATQIGSGSSDPDGDPLTFAVSPAGPYALGTTTVVLTLSDGLLSSSCAAVITVVDQTAPSITCPANITVPQSNGCGAVVSFTDPTATDNCSAATVAQTAGLISGSTFPTGTTVVTYTATDAAGNSASCSFNVNVTGVVIQPGSFALVGDANATGNDCFQLTPALNNRFGAIWYQNLLTLGSDFSLEFDLNLGSNDANGADGIAFVLQPVSTGSGSNGGGIGYQGILPSLDIEFDTWQNAQNGDPTADHIAINQNGNTNHASGGLVAPVTMPNMEDGQNHRVRFDWDANHTVLEVYFDNVLRTSLTQDIANTIFGGNANVYWGFTAATGGSVNDQRVCLVNLSFSEALMLSSTSSSLPCGAGGGIDLTIAGGTAPYSYNWSNGRVSEDISNVPAGIYCVTVTDQCGQSATLCDTVQFVADVTPPVVTCPANMTVGVDGHCEAVVNYAATATDNCALAGISYSPASGSTFALGTATITATATDGSGNTASCTFFVTVRDQSAPTVTCPANLVVQADGQCQAVANYSATVADNCGIVSLVFDTPSGSTFPLGLTNVTATATDGSGNSSTCTFAVTVQDVTVPVVSCPTNIVRTGCGATSVSYAATATDNCTGVSLGYSPVSGSTFPLGTSIVTATATDASGNTASCAFTVTVNDNVAPVITCPANIVRNGCVSTAVTFAANAIDNCQLAGVSYNPASGSNFPSGTTTVTATATDASGNAASCAFTVTVTSAPLVASVSSPADGCGNNVSSCCGITSGGHGSDGSAEGHGRCTDRHCDNFGKASIDCGHDEALRRSSNDWHGGSGSDGSHVVIGHNNCGHDGVATATVSGGCAPYSYTWSNGAHTASISGLTPGTYTVTITDASGQSVVRSVTLTQATPPTVSVTATNVACYGSNGGTATAAVHHGCGPYTYTWNNGAHTATITNLRPGTYCVTVTDHNGCSAAGCAVVTQPTRLVADAGSHRVVYPAYAPQACATLTGTVTGGTPGYSVRWTNRAGATLATGYSVNVCPTTTTVYYFRVVDARGCTTLDSVAVCPRNISCGSGRVQVCVRSGSGHNCSYSTQCVPVNQVAAILNNGGSLGACNTAFNCTYPNSSNCNTSHSKAGDAGEGAQNEVATLAVRAFPNPTMGELTLQVQCTHCGDEGKYSVKVTDIYGKIYLVDDVAVMWGEGSLKIDLSQLAAGVYLITVDNGDLRVVERVVKQ